MTNFVLDIDRPLAATQHVPIGGASVIIGRLPPSHVLVDDPLISDQHCELRREGKNWIVRDLDSTNGTFVDGRRLTAPVELVEQSSVEIGTLRLRVRPDADQTNQVGAELPKHAPTLRSDDGLHAWLGRRDRYLRWSTDWESQGHPARLLLRGDEALRARSWQTQAEGFAMAVEPQIAAWIAAGLVHARIRRRQSWSLALVTCAAAAAVIYHFNQQPDDPGEPPPLATQTTAVDERFRSEELQLPDEDSGSAPPQPVKREWILHPVAPGETLAEVAARYEVSPALLAQWNELNPDQPEVKAGQELKVIPRRPTLPPQRIEYQVETGEDLQTLAQRFGIPLHKLKLYNPGLAKVATGQTLVIWVDPEPLGLKITPAAITPPEVVVAQGAVSHGLPQQGWIEKSVQIPESPLYTRRNPVEMFTSSHMLQSLLQGVTVFRQQTNWQGKLVLADASLKDGGPIQPHKSHQSGRDIDIWLPTVRGVYKDSHIGIDRRPNPNEADWFVTWYLIESLLATKQIRNIFLSYELQENLHTAAKISGRTDEDLRSLIQWPNGNTRATVSHADGHIHHIHVRFRCPKEAGDCRDLGASAI